MPWHNPMTWTASQVVTATQLNQQVRDNLTYLLSRPHQRIIRMASANYTTGSTTFVDIDSANLSITLTISGSAVSVGFSGTVFFGAGGVPCFDFTVNGTRYTSTANGIFFALLPSSWMGIPVSYTALVTGLSVGSYTFRPVWRVTANTATLEAISSPVVFCAMEVA